MRPFILVLSAPSGGGKTTIAQALLAARDDVGYSISATTRPARGGEREGVDYYFLSPDEFTRRRDAGEFLEWAEYAGFWYGTLEAEADRVLGEGRHVILDIEVRGARQVRERRQDVVSIFILPPSAQVLLERLRGRGTGGGEDELRARMMRALEEIDEAGTYDYVVVNDDRAQAVADVAGIIDSESRRVSRATGLEDRLAVLRQDLVVAVGRSE